jgi:hypothetical protein
MEKIKYLLFLLLICNYSLGQHKKSMVNLLEILPDSLFNNDYEDIDISELNLIIKLYNNGKYEVDKNSTFYDYDAFHLIFKDQDKLKYLNVLVNEQKDYMVIFDNYSDVASEYGIKEFNDIIGFKVDYSTHLTTEPGRIVFYENKNEKLIDITKDVLNSFNFWKDNYDKYIVDSLIANYRKLFNVSHSTSTLLFKFTTSDTIEISDNLTLQFDSGIDLWKLDSVKFKSEFYTKKYIMDNGKLRLAE